MITYDAAHRLGAYLGLELEGVYLHRGTRAGAKALGFQSRNSLEVHELLEELRTLKPHQLEDCLCIYKDLLKGANPHELERRDC